MKREKQPLEYAYELLKGRPVDPQSIYGDASGSATTNTNSEEDEEVRKKAKALALYNAQTKSKMIDPPFSLVQKEYEAVLRQIYTSRAGDWGDKTQTSSAVPHGPDETGIASSTKKPETVGWVPQNQPTGNYRTTDQPINNFNDNNRVSIPRGPGATGKIGNSLYPSPTVITTVRTGRGQQPGQTFNMPYHDQPAGTGNDAQTGGYDTAVGSTQKVEKSQLGGYIAALYQENEFGQPLAEGAMMLDELDKAAQSGRPGGSMSYREQSTPEAGGVARMDEDTKRRILDDAKASDLTQAKKLEEIASRLEEEAAAEEPTDARLKSRTPSRKRMMAEKAHEQAAELLKRWNSGQYPSGSIVKKTTRHGAGWS